MFAGYRVKYDEDGNVTERGRRIEGRCCECEGDNKHLTAVYCLCKRSPLENELELNDGKKRRRHSVCWICLRFNVETGRYDCLERHLAHGTGGARLRPLARKK